MPISAIIEIPEGTKVFVDKKTKVKTMGIPFKFPNGENGILSITKLVKSDWKPEEDLQNIIIGFK